MECKKPENLAEMLLASNIPIMTPKKNAYGYDLHYHKCINDKDHKCKLKCIKCFNFQE